MQKLKDAGHTPVQGLKVQSNEVEHPWRKEMAQTLKKGANQEEALSLIGSCNVKVFMNLDKPGSKYTFGTPIHFPYDFIG